MSTTGFTMPGYRAYDYQLVLSPHEELRQRISRLRLEFHEKFQTESPLGGRPHLCLASFRQYGLGEERLLQRLQAIALGQQPLQVELKDFGSFPAHSIFINVNNKGQLQELVREIRSGAQRLMRFSEESKPFFMNDPYFLIARRLQPWQYEKGWLEFSHRAFSGRFMADGMLLLKRPAGERSYQILRRFDFLNLPVNTRQGELFA